MDAYKVFYLVDFENVGLKGLEGADQLTADDCVNLFSTKNAAKIDTATLARFNATTLKVHEVSPKKQAVDMHLVTYLGYLLASHGTSAKYVIVSNDTNYDDILRFWRTEQGFTVQRQGALTKVKKAAQPAAPTVPQGDAQITASAKEKIALNLSVQQALSKAKMGNEVIGYVASLVSKQYGVKNAKQVVYRTIISKFGQQRGLNIYNHIKKLL